MGLASQDLSIRREAGFESLAKAFQEAGDKLILVVTGAGVSLASGISTFRGGDSGAVWKENPMEKGTVRYFQEDPVDAWLWFMKRFGAFEGKEPNPSHDALAALERWQQSRGGQFLLVTQNIDSLHEKAGSKEMVKIHGTADRYRCFEYGCQHGAPYGSIAKEDVDTSHFLANPSLKTVPRCPDCGGLIRFHVLWFDEHYLSHNDYEARRVIKAAGDVAFVLFIGTSFSVGITSSILELVRQQEKPIFSMNPGMEEGEFIGIYNLQVRSEEALPELCRRLGVDGD